jgi:hypothetical protein
MHKAKSQKLEIWNLQKGQVVWSNYFESYVIFMERDFDDEFLFKFLEEDRYCILHSSDIEEPVGLIKELL